MTEKAQIRTKIYINHSKIYINHSSVKQSVYIHTVNLVHYATLLRLDFVPTLIIL